MWKRPFDHTLPRGKLSHDPRGVPWVGVADSVASVGFCLVKPRRFAQGSLNLSAIVGRVVARRTGYPGILGLSVTRFRFVLEIPAPIVARMPALTAAIWAVP